MNGQDGVVMEIDPGAIEVGKRMRRLNEDHVAALAASIRETGLLSPITVVMAPGVAGTTHRLVAGRHRLEAIKALRWNHIDCFVTTADEHARQFIEIDENLIRAELTELERGQHLERRKEIFDAKGGKKIATPGGEQTVGFDRDTADKTGMTKQAVHKSRTRAKKIDPEVQDDIKATPIADIAVELDALASMTPADQRRAVEMFKSGGAASVREAHESIAPLSGMHTEPPLIVEERASRLCKFKDALECLSRMPSAETFANTASKAERAMITWKLPIARTWLDNFEAAWTERRTGASRNSQDKRAITRAWDRTSDDGRKAFVAELKRSGWFDDPAQAPAERRTDEPDIPAALDRRADNDARAA